MHTAKFQPDDNSPSENSDIRKERQKGHSTGYNFARRCFFFSMISPLSELTRPDDYTGTSTTETCKIAGW
jgi:hypothetical protein